MSEDYAKKITQLVAATLKAESASRTKKVSSDTNDITVTGGSPGAIAQQVDKMRLTLGALNKKLKAVTDINKRALLMKQYYNKLKSDFN